MIPTLFHAWLHSELLPLARELAGEQEPQLDILLEWSMEPGGDTMATEITYTGPQDRWHTLGLESGTGHHRLRRHTLWRGTDGGLRRVVAQVRDVVGGRTQRGSIVARFERTTASIRLALDGVPFLDIVDDEGVSVTTDALMAHVARWTNGATRTPHPLSIGRP